ncbi:MAG: transposase, partial [Cytophagales bacterium]|nr:transposase [Cytophagales bacterium]
KDRKYQIWERNPLSIELRTKEVSEQKLDYIHLNPVKAGICHSSIEYKYSSAKFYELNQEEWDFLTYLFE